MKLTRVALFALALIAGLALLNRADAAMTVESNIDARGITFGANSSSPTIERMRITQSGNVGISNTAPIAKLDVVGTISTSNVIQIGSGTTCVAGTAGAIRYNNSSNTLDYCNGAFWTSTGPSSTSPVSFLATRGGTNQTVSANTPTKIQFTSKAFDTNNNFDATTNYRFTPTIPGKYLVHANVYCSGAAGLCQVYIYKNGASLASNWMPSITGSADSTVGVTTIVDMNGTTDYLEEYALNANATTIIGNGTTTYFTGALLGPQAGGSGSATPAGSTADVQFNNGGALAADTGKFTYTTASGLLSTTAISATYDYSRYVSSTTIYNPGSFSGNTIAANSLSSTLVSASYVSSTYIQISSASTVLSCSISLAGTMRYTSGTMQVCDGSSWSNIGIGVPTGTIAAFATASCPTGWSEYTPSRGRFLRGIDNGAGLDPSGTRVAGNLQADAVGPHSHKQNTYLSQAPSGGMLLGYGTQPWTGWGGIINNNDVGISTSGTGISSETRPVNVAVTFCQYNRFQSALQAGVATLASLSDVSVGVVTAGKYLAYNGSAWVPSSTTGGAGVTGGTANYGAIFSGATTLTTDSAIYVDTTNHRLGVGTSTPGYPLEVNGYAAATNFYQTSDRRLKTNITPIANGLDVIRRLRPVTFDWKKDNRASAGLIAQEVEPILPHAVVSTTEGTYSLDYIQTVPYLIRSVQQLEAANDNLQRDLDTMRAEVRALKRASRYAP